MESMGLWDIKSSEGNIFYAAFKNRITHVNSDQSKCGYGNTFTVYGKYVDVVT